MADNHHFQTFIFFLILMTAALMGVETSPTLAYQYGDFFFWFACVSQGIFLFEIAVRIVAAPSLRAFFQDGWNRFDFIVVVLSLIPAIGPMALIARLLRVLRVLRVFSASAELRRFMDIIAKTRNEIYYAAVIVLVMGYIYTIGGYYLFTEIDPDRWGSFWRAALSVFYLALFQNVSNFVEPLVRASGFYIVYFLMFYITFIGLAISCIAASLVTPSKTDHD